MKKEYLKPILVVETFQLNATFAGSCKDANKWITGKDGVVDMGDSGPNGMPVTPPYVGMFVSDSACTVVSEAECYQSMVEGISAGAFIS